MKIIQGSIIALFAMTMTVGCGGGGDAKANLFSSDVKPAPASKEVAKEVVANIASNKKTTSLSPF